MSMGNIIGFYVGIAIVVVPLVALIAYALIRLAAVINRFIYPLWAGSPTGGPVSNRIGRELVFTMTVAFPGGMIAGELAHVFSWSIDPTPVLLPIVLLPIFHWRKQAKLRGAL